MGWWCWGRVFWLGWWCSGGVGVGVRCARGVQIGGSDLVQLLALVGDADTVCSRAGRVSAGGGAAEVETMTQQVCKDCGVQIPRFEAFSGPRCVGCHRVRFDAAQPMTAGELAAMWRGVVR